jgi:hypothetical protein
VEELRELDLGRVAKGSGVPSGYRRAPGPGDDITKQKAEAPLGTPAQGAVVLLLVGIGGS